VDSSLRRVQLQLRPLTRLSRDCSRNRTPVSTRIVICTVRRRYLPRQSRLRTGSDRCGEDDIERNRPSGGNRRQANLDVHPKVRAIASRWARGPSHGRESEVTTRALFEL